MECMKSYLIAGITFDGSCRQKNLKKSIDTLKDLFPRDTSKEEFIYKIQGDYVHHNLLFRIKRILSQWYLERKWRKHKEISSQYFLSLIYLLPKLFYLGILNKKYYIKNINANNALMQKHFYVWKYFLKTEKDFLIVLEDDVIIDKNQEINIYFNKVLNKLEEEDYRMIYIDLAGGLTREQMKIEKNLITNTAPLTELKIFASRTTCAYVINKKTASYFIKKLETDKFLLEAYPIDWVINLLGINMGEENEDYVCIHTEPPIFTHGSVERKFISTIQFS